MMRTKFFMSARYLLVLLPALWLTAFAASQEAGALAPNFTLKSLNDNNLSLREVRGQVVMINFWASWCAPCRQEMPALNALYDKYRGAGFVLFGVNVESDPAKAKQVISKLKVDYPILFDTEKKVSALYQISAMPTTVLIDRDGKIRYVQKGYLAGYENTYQSQIRELLKE